MRQHRWQECPRHEEQLREAVSAREVPVAYVHDDRGETEHDEKTRARYARPQQTDEGAQDQNENPARQILNDVVLERAQRHLEARQVFLDQRAAAHEQIAHARAWRMALDLFLELARGPDELTVDGAHEIERLDTLALKTTHADQEVLHDRKARPRATDHAP